MLNERACSRWCSDERRNVMDLLDIPKVLGRCGSAPRTAMSSVLKPASGKGLPNPTSIVALEMVAAQKRAGPEIEAEDVVAQARAPERFSQASLRTTWL
jgi:hypothetical protein